MKKTYSSNIYDFPSRFVPSLTQAKLAQINRLPKDGAIADDAYRLIPDYCNDLNAMHEAESNVLDTQQWDVYRKTLAKEWATNDDDGMWAAINATAHQRAEAFLKAIGKWEEGK